MSRNAAGLFTLDPRYLVSEGDTILPSQHNPVLEDLQTDANTPRPIVAGGTGASTATTARTNLSVYSIADVDDGFTPKVATRTALKALDTATTKAVVLTEASRQKLFMWMTGDFTDSVAGDPSELAYIPADGIDPALGCWVAVTGAGASIVPVIQGGTGANDAATALDNLGGMASATYDPNAVSGDAFDMANMVEATDAKVMTAAERTKLAGVEAAADVTDATNVDAAGATMNTDTDVSGNSWVLDEDDMASDSATKVPTQQSVKAKIDNDTILKVANRTALKAVDTAKHSAAYLIESGREGQFVWNSSDLSTFVTADTAEGIYVAPTSDATGASGAWVRQFNGSLFPEWFGAVGDDAVTDDQASLNEALALAIAMGGGSIELQARRYRMSAPLTGSLPQGVRVRVYGQGKDNSELVFDAGVNGLAITVDGDSRNNGAIFIYDDFSLTTLSDVAGTAATFIGVRTSGKTTAMLASSRVKMKGADETKGWAKGATHTDMNGCDYIAPEFLGKQNDQTANAWEFTGTNNPTDVRLLAPRATFFRHAVDVAGAVEGTIVLIPMFVAGARGIYHHTTAAEPQLEVRGGHINTHTHGVYSARATQSTITGIDIYENPVGGGATWTAIEMANGDHNKIFGNTIHGWSSAATNRYGIVVGSSPRRTVIFGNTLRGYDGTRKLTAGIVFDGTQDGSVREFGNVFDDATVTARLSGGGDTASKENRTWAQSVVVTLAGGAPTEMVDVALPAGFLSDDPVDATLTAQSGSFLVAKFNQQDAATTNVNARFSVSTVDASNITAGAVRFGVSVRG